jgi:hypothetical protein
LYNILVNEKEWRNAMRFVITVRFENGEITETTRGTFLGMEEVLSEAIADKNVVGFSVEEIQNV